VIRRAAARSGSSFAADYPYPSTPDDPYVGGGIDFDHLQHVIVVGGEWLLILVCALLAALGLWYHNSPETYERYFAAPARRARWRVWVYASW